MKKIAVLFVFLLAAFALSATAQPREIEKKPVDASKPAPAPESFAAHYQGGLYGFSKKAKGTLKFDDLNERIVFYTEENKELFSIPFRSILVVYPQSQSVQSTTGAIVGAVVPFAGAFIKEKRRYLVINFSDPDVDAKGITSFKLETKELLDSVIYTIGEKAKLKQRGDAFFRPNEAKKEN
jgi:hypothetical protein